MFVFPSHLATLTFAPPPKSNPFSLEQSFNYIFKECGFLMQETSIRDDLRPLVGSPSADFKAVKIMNLLKKENWTEVPVVRRLCFTVVPLPSDIFWFNHSVSCNGSNLTSNLSPPSLL